jgi:hypothetical protein
MRAGEHLGFSMWSAGEISGEQGALAIPLFVDMDGTEWWDLDTGPALGDAHALLQY